MSITVIQKTNNVSVARVFEIGKLVDQVMGYGLGILVAVGLAVGVDVWDAVANAPDAQLLEGGFWAIVGRGAIVTALRSALSAIGTALGLTIPGVSSA